MPDFDTTDAAIIAVMGEDVTYTHNGGSPVVVKGFYQSPDDEPDTQDIEFIARAPQVTVLNTDAPVPTKKDTFLIRNVPYRVKDFEVDEAALVVFHLLENFQGLFSVQFSQEFD